MGSPSHGSERRCRELVSEAGGDVRLVENGLFVGTHRAFEEWTTDDGGFRHDQFSRWMRGETGLLIGVGETPPAAVV